MLPNFFLAFLVLLQAFAFVRGQDEGEDRDDNVPLAFVLVTAAGMSTVIGAAFVFCDRWVTQKNFKFLGAGLGFASGIMIYIALVEILQSSFGDFAACQCLWDADEAQGEESVSAIFMGSVMFFLGMGMVYGLDFIVHKLYEIDGFDSRLGLSKAIQARDEADAERESLKEGDVEEGEDAENKEDDETDTIVPEAMQVKLNKMGILAAIALGLHNFPEGVATFVGTLDDPSVGAGLAFAIAIHNIPEGLCVAIPIYYASGSRWKGFLVSFASGLCEIIGALLAYAFLEEILGPAAFGVIFGIVAGIMTTLVLKELVPTALKYDPSGKWAINSIMLGMFVMSFSILLFEV